MTMTDMSQLRGLLAGWLCICLTAPAWAEDGQAELDRAVELKVQATTLQQLDEVIDLCEQALKKGLNADDEVFAVQLLTGTLYQCCKPKVELLIEARPFPPELEERRKGLLTDLRKIIKYDDNMGPAHLMIAQLEGLRGGDRQAAHQAVDKALALLDEAPAKAEALLVRGQLQETEEARLADFDQAVQLSPGDPKVWQTRAFYFLAQGQVDKAVDDLNSLLKRDDENLLARFAIAETLLQMDKFDEAMKHVDKIIAAKPNALAYKLRAQLWAVQERLDKALEDIDAALKLAPNDLQLYLLRARLYHLEDREALAKTDVDRVLQRVPDLAPALELRAEVLAGLDQFDSAIADITQLLKAQPDNLLYQIQLAIYHNAAGHYQQAIDTYGKVLQANPGNDLALRGRGDAYLNLGAHQQAVADYQAALEAAADEQQDSGTLNNFAWVLATSPDDSVRDGKRALELAQKACELTDYKQAHILSTLAAAHAELGDFKAALEWSQKACDIADQEIREQLQLELKSYQDEKPWREKKPVPDDGESAPGAADDAADDAAGKEPSGKEPSGKQAADQ